MFTQSPIVQVIHVSDPINTTDNFVTFEGRILDAVNADSLVRKPVF